LFSPLAIPVIMPRQTRLDGAGVLNHIMIRGKWWYGTLCHQLCGNEGEEESGRGVA